MLGFLQSRTQQNANHCGVDTPWVTSVIENPYLVYVHALFCLLTQGPPPLDMPSDTASSPALPQSPMAVHGPAAPATTAVATTPFMGGQLSVEMYGTQETVPPEPKAKPFVV